MEILFLLHKLEKWKKEILEKVGEDRNYTEAEVLLDAVYLYDGLLDSSIKYIKNNMIE